MPIVLTEMILLPTLVLVMWTLAYRSRAHLRRPALLPIAVRDAARDRTVGLHRCQRAVPPFLL